MDRYKDYNSVTLSGLIKEDLEFVTEFKGTKIYKTTLGIFRLSGVEDILPIYISDRLEDFSKLSKGLYLKISGSMRSSQYRVGNKKRTRVYVYVKDIIEYFDDVPDDWYINEVELEGRLFKKPQLRKSKTDIVKIKNSNKKEKADLAEVILEVYRGYDKYDHIPLIVWGTDAKYISEFERGEKIAISGRFQSRYFIRHVKGSDDELEHSIAYEVSVRNIEVLN